MKDHNDSDAPSNKMNSPIVFIFMPVVTPIFADYGLGLVWVANFVSVDLQTSFLNPPFGFPFISLS